MTRKSRRMVLIAAALGIFGLALGMAMYAFRGNIELFLSPTEIVKRQPAFNTRMRIGGLVKEGSYVKITSNSATFSVTDMVTDIKVEYAGNEPLPELFREGQGVIALGVLDQPGLFKSDKVLAKHDETYMPREVADALKKQGQWKGPLHVVQPIHQARRNLVANVVIIDDSIVTAIIIAAATPL